MSEQLTTKVPTDKELAALLPSLPLEQRIEAVIRKYVGAAVSSAYDGETAAPAADARIAHYLMGKLRPWLTEHAKPAPDVADLVARLREFANELSELGPDFQPTAARVMREAADVLDRTRFLLPRRTYTVLRCDGKAFHTFTRRCEKPYDARLVEAMDAAALALCREAQGTCFAYIQSDEISVLLQDFGDIKTDAWFDGNLQKIVSVAASIVTAAFNAQYSDGTSDHYQAQFDCRAFTIPDAMEVENYFIWRQQDATRNSIQSTAQSLFSQKQLHGLNVSALQDLMMLEKGVNWNDLPVEQKRGRAVVKTEDYGWDINREIPIFTADRNYLSGRIPRLT